MNRIKIRSKVYLCSFFGVVLLVFPLLFFFSCVPEKSGLKTEPAASVPASRLEAENLFRQGCQELEKFTVPGYKKAVENFEQALTLDPNYHEVIGRLALAYSLWSKERKELGLDNMSQWIKARYYAERAERLGLQSEFLKAEALILNARNFLTQTEYGEIFRSTQAPLRRDRPEMIISYLRDLFSTASFKSKTINPALENLDRVLKDNPDDPEARIFKVWIQMLTVDDENLQKTKELKPGWALPDFLLGLFQKNRGEMEAAEKFFWQALEKNPEHPRVLTELGEIYFFKREFQQAEDFLSRALQLDDEMPRAHLLSGLICYEKGDYEQALTHFKAVSSLVPDNDEAIYYQALILIDLARWPEAIEALNSLIKLYGSYEIFGYSLRALSYLMLDKLAEAEADCRQALEIGSKYYLPYFIFGLIFFKKEDWKKASENFLISLNVDKSFDDGHYYLGQTYLQLGLLESAEKELKKAMELFVFASGQTEKMIKQALEKGWTKKAELLTRRKKELEAKIEHCQKLLVLK